MKGLNSFSARFRPCILRSKKLNFLKIEIFSLQVHVLEKFLFPYILQDSDLYKDSFISVRSTLKIVSSYSTYGYFENFFPEITK